jgi:hypothetical protein
MAESYAVPFGAWESADFEGVFSVDAPTSQNYTEWLFREKRLIDGIDV